MTVTDIINDFVIDIINDFVVGINGRCNYTTLFYRVPSNRKS